MDIVSLLLQNYLEAYMSATGLKRSAITQQVTKPLLLQKHPFVAELGT